MIFAQNTEFVHTDSFPIGLRCIILVEYYTVSLAKTSSKPKLQKRAALPESQRTVLHLHYYEGYTLREIARLLGVTVPTVKMRLKRGRDALRNTWEESL